MLNNAAIRQKTKNLKKSVDVRERKKDKLTLRQIARAAAMSSIETLNKIKANYPTDAVVPMAQLNAIMQGITREERDKLEMVEISMLSDKYENYNALLLDNYNAINRVDISAWGAHRSASWARRQIWGSVLNCGAQVVKTLGTSFYEKAQEEQAQQQAATPSTSQTTPAKPRNKYAWLWGGK